MTDVRRLTVAGGTPETSITEFAARWSQASEAVVYVGRRGAERVYGYGWSVERGPGADVTIVVQDVNLPTAGS